MSLTINDPTAAPFLERFEDLRASLRRSQIGLGLGLSALVAGTCLIALTAADFWFEWTGAARTAGLACAVLITLATVVRRVIAPARWWSRPRTAAEIERRFPQLGQRIRTVIQYGRLDDDAIADAGVAPGLVEALGEEIEGHIQPLSLNRVVPREKVWLVAAASVVPVAVLLVAAAAAPEWRTALKRALLGNAVYTSLAILPGDTRIEQGESVDFTVELKGRPRRHVTLRTRPANRPTDPWTTTPMHPSDRSSAKGGAVPRVATVDAIQEPLVYWVDAGPESSSTYEIDVRYPLAVQTLEIGLNAPAYTRLAPSIAKGGDLQAIAGTIATFRLSFDAAPAEASLVFTDPSIRPKKGDPEPKPLVLPLRAESGTYVASTTLAKSGHYRIEARTADGRAVAKNRYRIDVHEDRAPRVSFDEPNEALEVHPVAEVRNRIRLSDDFGLSRAGIVVRMNDGEERTLLLKEFATGSADALTATATLEEMLMLETFKATSTDSIVYYAFAEDNHPDGARRTETDLRFLDIRPFKREYQFSEGGGGGGGDGESTSLDELIARQRFNLSRASRHARRRPNDRTPAEDPIRIATFEETLVGLVREFTEGLEGVVGERIEPLHQAEEAMLASVETLDRGRTEEASTRMTEALHHLIEVRRTFRLVIGGGGGRAGAARAFDRRMNQKLRPPRSKSAEADSIALELEQLALAEDSVHATLKNLNPENEAKEDETKARADALGRQETIADEARALEERLKRLEQASDLAKERMTSAAEVTEKAAAALTRGNTKEGTAAARAGALLLHEVARQVKGDVSTEIADELAQARDLADELARQEAEFAEYLARRSSTSSPTGDDRDQNGEPGNEKAPETDAEPGSNAGSTTRSEWKAMTDAEKLEQMKEAARTLEEWLKGAAQNAEGDAASQVRELLEQGETAAIVEKADRVGALYLDDRKKEAADEARDLARTLEGLARRIDGIHRGMIAPELARLTELDQRVARLASRLDKLETEAQRDEWLGQSEALLRDLEKAGLTAAAEALERVLKEDRSGVKPWNAGPDGYLVPPADYAGAFSKVSAKLRERVQELILRDLAASRDESTPPEYRELVERYYEVLSTDGAKATP
ncbi:hypothetical protein [Paludisphaera borealis]|uniref:Uncharacterized protein n=1 Tax=Paludisphaera borealis TaxID=1387353 RepID=A0A1U7CJT7_9BACT|nr:hypothetical protein [Paludisphaera borealis]APW59167.1 hypothetical protein BSF38_00581 [Paludisphaera borealis]